MLLRGTFPEIRFSPVYRSAPLHVTDQAAFLNAVAMFETEHEPKQVQKVLQEIEAECGKKIEERFGPRTLDLDLLLYDDITMDEEDLTLPHPRLHERRFVLQPLSDVGAGHHIHHSALAPLSSLLKATEGQECVKTDLVL